MTTATYDRATTTTGAGTGAGTASYSYDTLGRATSVPQVDVAGSAPVAAGLTYFVNDLVASESQAGGVTRSFGLDGLRRLNTWTDTSGVSSVVVVNHYDGVGDAPAWVSSSDGVTTTTSRNVLGPDGNVALTTSRVGSGVVSAMVNIVNPHGDVFTTIPDVVNVSAALVGAAQDTDEFGVTLTSSPSTYGWVGAKSRATDTVTGLIQMGVRVYDPVTGRFESVDPVFGGNDNPYVYPGDPVNGYDLTGQNQIRPDAPGCSKKKCSGVVIVVCALKSPSCRKFVGSFHMGPLPQWAHGLSGFGVFVVASVAGAACVMAEPCGVIGGIAIGTTGAGLEYLTSTRSKDWNTFDFSKGVAFGSLPGLLSTKRGMALIKAILELWARGR